MRVSSTPAIPQCPSLGFSFSQADHPPPHIGFSPSPSESGLETALQKVDPSTGLQQVCEGPYIAGD